jgi:hypothetical protein
MFCLHAGPKDFTNRACDLAGYRLGVPAATSVQGHSGHSPNPFVSQT